MSKSMCRVVLKAQLDARQANALRALEDFDSIDDVTQLDHLLARTDRSVMRSAHAFTETDTVYNAKLTNILANEAYTYAIEHSQVPCLTREERNGPRGKKKT